MSDSFERLISTGEMVNRLCDSEDEIVKLRFGSAIEMPSSKYDGVKYETELSDKATLEATVNMARVEDNGETLICSVLVSEDEMNRIGMNQSKIYTENIDGETYSYLEVLATRKWWLDEYRDLSREEKRQAEEDGIEDEVLAPWEDNVEVTVQVERTERCLEKDYHSGFDNPQYSPPDCTLGNLIDVCTDF